MTSAATTSPSTLSTEAKPLGRAERRLRLILRANATFSLVGGVIGLAAASRLADLLGVDQVWLVAMVCAGLIGFAAAVFAISRTQIDTLMPAARAVSVADLMWVLASLALIGAGVLDAAGAVVIVLVAVAVADFGLGQALSVRAHRRAAR